MASGTLTGWRATPRLLVGGLAVLAGVTALVSSLTSGEGLAPKSAAYRVVPASILVNGEILFTRLSDAQLRVVRVSPTDARRIATARFDSGHHARVVLESLGGYVDQNQIVHDWIGTRSYVPAAVPAYLVRMLTANVVTVGNSTNHYWNVVVSARSGRILVSFSYD